MVFWHWLVVAAAFAVIEVAVPAMVCIWLAAAALGAAAIAWFAPRPRVGTPGADLCRPRYCERRDRPDGLRPHSTAIECGPSQSASRDLYRPHVHPRTANRRRSRPAQSRRHGVARRGTRPSGRDARAGDRRRQHAAARRAALILVRCTSNPCEADDLGLFFALCGAIGGAVRADEDQSDGNRREGAPRARRRRA